MGLYSNKDLDMIDKGIRTQIMHRMEEDLDDMIKQKVEDFTETLHNRKQQAILEYINRIEITFNQNAMEYDTIDLNIKVRPKLRDNLWFDPNGTEKSLYGYCADDIKNVKESYEKINKIKREGESIGGDPLKEVSEYYKEKEEDEKYD